MNKQEFADYLTALKKTMSQKDVQILSIEAYSNELDDTKMLILKMRLK